MRLQLLRIDRGDGTLDLVWQIGRIQYSRTVNASEVDTRAKAGAYILSQLAEVEDMQTYILEAHQENGNWVLDGFTADEDRDVGRGEIRRLPGWAEWSAQEADAWVVANATNLAGVVTTLRAIVRLLIHIRDSVL